MNLTNLQPTTPACHSTVDFHMISVITTMMPTDKSEILTQGYQVIRNKNYERTGSNVSSSIVQ